MTQLSFDPELSFSAAIREELILAGFLRGSPPNDLSRLHECLPANCLPFVDTADFTILTKHFFDVFERGVGPICTAYQRFRDLVVKPFLGVERLVYQRMPAVRFIFPEQPSLIPGKDELGSFHADALNGHPLAEINFWVPCTPCGGSNSLQVLGDTTSKEVLDHFEEEWQSTKGEPFTTSMFTPELHLEMYRSIGQRARRLAQPVVGREGDAFVFSPLTIHGTLRNHTETTRVSVDFRVMRIEDYGALKREYRALSGSRFYRIGDLYDS